VAQNIFSKKLFNEAAQAGTDGPRSQSLKLDKLNLLCYSSALAFILTVPIWFWSEGISITQDFFHDGSIDLSEKPNSFDHGRLTLEFVFNGSFHFGQNILAFILLSMVSPVTYSVASLLKRVFVITVTLLWFRNPTTYMQGIGIALTFLGLYLYDRSSESNKADRKARLMSQKNRTSLLPLNESQHNVDGLGLSTPFSVGHQSVATTHGALHYANGHTVAGDGLKKSDDSPGGHGRGAANGGWLPPGTKQEDTWRAGDKVIAV
jgi:solute carrier family 35 protein E1